MNHKLPKSEKGDNAQYRSSGKMVDEIYEDKKNRRITAKRNKMNIVKSQVNYLAPPQSIGTELGIDLRD